MTDAPSHEPATVACAQVAVVCDDDPASRQRAAALSARYGWPLRSGAPHDAGAAASPEPGWWVVVTEHGTGFRPARGEGSGDAPWIAPAAVARSSDDPLIRAVRGRGRNRASSVVDLTAGFGRDALALAAAGLQVVALECEPLPHALFADALRRAAASDDASVREAAARTTLHHAEAESWLTGHEAQCDVVYLDPMHPRSGRAGARKPLPWLRRLTGAVAADELDRASARLLQAARSWARTRVVVKRPAKAAPLAPGRSGVVRAKAVRYDLYPGRDDAA